MTIDVYQEFADAPWPKGIGQQSRFNAAPIVQVLAKGDEMGSTVRGPLGVYHDVPRRDPEECDHTATVCRWCVHGWLNDHHVRVFTHGWNGYKNTNCRCEVCSQAASSR